MGVPPDGAPPRQTRTTHHHLLWGAGFGLLGDALFYHAGVGLNAALWIAVLALAGGLAYRRTRRPLGALPVLFGVACVFGGCLAWRASPFLRFWNAAAVAAAAVAIAVHLRGTLLGARLVDYLRGMADVAGDVLAGPVQALGESPRPAPGRQPARPAAIVAGAVLAVPVVLVFGSLLVAADPVMEAFARNLFDWDLDAVFTHLAILGGSGWLATGWLRRVGLAPAGPAGRWVVPARSLSAISLGIPLGALTLLLAAFIGLQTRYLFGGPEFVTLTGLTYAQFARRGFFELVALCALALPLLVAAQHLVDRSARVSVDTFRALAPTLAGLIALVMVSALARMRLYVQMYGLTEDRLYATAFMLWLGAVFAWFVVTEFGGRLERFATGAVAAGFLQLLSLNVVNPDAVIARVNLARPASAVQLDAAYLARLSTDAVPTLTARWPTLDAGVRCTLRTTMGRAVSQDGDWRAWTWSGWRAARSAHAVSLPQGCGAG
jgi:hypothetical protein